MVRLDIISPQLDELSAVLLWLHIQGGLLLQAPSLFERVVDILTLLQKIVSRVLLFVK